MERSEKQIKIGSYFIAAYVIIGIPLVVSSWTFIPRNQPTKTYSVSLTTDQWQSRLQTINASKEIMRKSTLPGNVISQYSDSLSVMAQEISEQVGAQIQREQKVDSTKPKK